MVALAWASCARTSSADTGTALATLETAAPIVDCVDAAGALLTNSAMFLLFVLGRESGVFAERALGDTSGAGEPYEGDGEP